ncbi:MAG: carbon-nitrogen hydrolase family protein [bacterium]|nr:carbon-nitrogen hydrolase family protein [bacterium]
MSESLPKIKAAVVQAAPVLFNREATIEKTIQLTQEASKNGANLVLFPEAFIPAYPRGLSFGTVVGSRNTTGRKLWQLYWENAIDVPGPHTKRLANAAKKSNLYLTIGVIERSPTTNKTLYCTLLYFNPKGQLIGKHQKLKPTAAERIIWGEGDSSTLTTINTPLGTLGGLICWENYMPLARMAMYTKGVDIYLAPTADARETWTSTMIHIALEGRCFVLGCNQFITKDMYPKHRPGIEDLQNQPNIMSNGGSIIVSPLGKILAGPLRNKEGILYADLDLSEVDQGKMDFDVVGHYARPDVFQFQSKE